jgi:ATP-dependent Clp protease, protease subunit
MTAPTPQHPGPPPLPVPLPPVPPGRPRPASPQPLPPALSGPVPVAVGTVAADPVLERLLDERIVYVAGELDDAAADRVIPQLLLLGALDPRRDIVLYLSTAGGSATAALAVHDTMRAVAADVATRAVGVVGAAGAVLLAAGTAGKRAALPHARILLHHPATAIVGPAAAAGGRAGLGAQLRREITELTAGHCGRPIDAVDADAEAGRWFPATEAVEYGLVDGVLPS